MTEKVTTSLHAGVYTITLADPDNRNALSRQLTRELMAAMDRVDTDDEIRVVVLTNEGTVFCAGADLSERSDDDRPDASVDESSEAADPLGFFGRIRRSSKPWVGKINGHAVAGGLGLAAATDISVALDTAKMGFSEVRIGVAPAIISVICLPKMRASEASEAFLRGNRFPATEAARLGLINYAVPADQVNAKVDEIVADLVLGGPLALAASKELVNDVPHMAFDQAMAFTTTLSGSLFESDEGQEGMKSYLEKRTPSWVPEG
ncbi:MAG: methylglutaconyl-CoA hydratase [Acidimicrobiales bacterium]|jgi:methylglutaconyl-CoA hydratase